MLCVVDVMQWWWFIALRGILRGVIKESIRVLIHSSAMRSVNAWCLSLCACMLGDCEGATSRAHLYTKTRGGWAKFYKVIILNYSMFWRRIMETFSYRTNVFKIRRACPFSMFGAFVSILKWYFWGQVDVSKASRVICGHCANTKTCKCTLRLVFGWSCLFSLVCKNSFFRRLWVRIFFDLIRYTSYTPWPFLRLTLCGIK